METSWAQSKWDNVLDFWDHDDFNIRVYGTFVVSFLVYWGIGGLVTIVDYTGNPKFLMQYRVQENVKTYPINKSQIQDLITVVGFKQLLTFPFLILNYKWDVHRGVKFERQLPSLWTAVWQIAVFAILTEVTFYYSHRMLHHPLIYKWIHKKHHTWVSPIAFASAFAHPFEHIVSNVIPIALGPMILQSHTSLLWFYITYATFETLTVHSGFHFPLLKSPEFHDFHHLKFNYNFGVTGLMDYLHGTDSLFRKSKQFKRNYRTWTTTPVKVLIP